MSVRDLIDQKYPNKCRVKDAMLFMFRAVLDTVSDDDMKSKVNQYSEMFNGSEYMR